ncbi:hypothetical protein HanIR_Chr07g0326371 [Helianthus annuus]|nr:hypothetical protein HanIR_Chr07g0326371 [Helianthus annuus]
MEVKMEWKYIYFKFMTVWDPHFASSPTSKKRRRGRGRGRWFGVARVDGLGRMGDDPIPCSLRVNSSGYKHNRKIVFNMKQILR